MWTSEFRAWCEPAETCIPTLANFTSIFGPDGQKLTEQFRYGVSWKEQPFKREYPEHGMSVAECHKAEKKRGNLLRTLTGRRFVRRWRIRRGAT